ncbi:MAG: type IV pilus biogenesis/stability protein PilW [Chromatiales bacterium 21-64-14]|nr:MAG: type IV pilus biogenesis/stability protein PilW [Chromatiales bacterium 21-64-14]
MGSWAGHSSSDFRQLSGNESKPAAINTQLGIAYMQDNKPSLALDALKKALRQDPDLALAHNAIAVLYQQLGEYDKAGRHFRRAVELEPKDSDAQNNYGAFLCRRGRIEEAERHFQAALNNPLYTNPERAYFNWGFCAVKARDDVKAARYLRLALQRDPKYAPALLEMAKLSYRQKQYLNARGYLERYQAVAPPTADSLWAGIQIERVLGDRNAVASYALLLKSKFPDSDQTRQFLESRSNGPAPGH